MADTTDTKHVDGDVRDVQITDADVKDHKDFEEVQPHDATAYSNHPEETQVTARAILVGMMLGTIVGASNLYLGLKTGFTFGASLFGAIGGFAILKPLSRVIGGHFGPKENCTVQTAATASGGLTIIFVSAIPAMYKLNLLGASPKEDIGRLMLLTLVGSYYGLFFAVPLRKYFVIKQKLPFPSPTASAYTIRSLHEGAAGEAAGIKKAKVMFGCFFAAIIWTIIGYFVPGILKDMHVFYWLYSWGYHAAIQAENWHWWFEWTPAFIGAGMLSGMNASASLAFGSFLAWGLIGPMLVANGLAFGGPKQLLMGMEPTDPGFEPDYIHYMAAITADPKNAPSPRYWMLWPGVMLMVVTSFAELGWNWKYIYSGLKGAIDGVFRKNGGADVDGEDVDPAPAHEQVPVWAWSSGILVAAVLTIIVLRTQFNVGIGEGILSIILAFFFAFIGLQSAGYTDINPVSAVAKTSQLVFGGVTKGQGMVKGQDLIDAQRLNLVAGTVAAAAAAQSVDMVGDLKTGHILGAAPKGQFWAQVAGTLISVPVCVGLFVLYSQAYPCITETDAYIKANKIECPFDMPSVGAWKACAIALTDPNPAIPNSSGYVAIGAAFFAVLTVILRNTLSPKLARFVPNTAAIGIAFVLPDTIYGSAMVFGAAISLLWERKSPASAAFYMSAVAAGLIAGEGIGGLIQAILQLAGITQAEHANYVGCPFGPGGC
ncbi:OPT oligopeptide transporter protein-domain-containing protein [Fimicolochytrium jonesii]|uniref:OPT oligopeptide transporter protein-domain-containing protein n=1 Tax=Fimicolochytrium jonesii TaxID=1396493 RepID=UPI0022FEBA00|nr:OPT oligopeptide transporter protein-domain-containing protein [Fimicolochytrium jonesii]KAI8821685.1 OPT oligopeptide transporter protein-domain-containing protein [Fimicolochytrium jonesii]